MASFTRLETASQRRQFCAGASTEAQEDDGEREDCGTEEGMLKALQALPWSQHEPSCVLDPYFPKCMWHSWAELQSSVLRGGFADGSNGHKLNQRGAVREGH